MATHAEIEAVELPLIEALTEIRHRRLYDPAQAIQAAQDGLQLLNTEQRALGYRDAQNRNHWGTLGVNAAVLAHQTEFPELKTAAQTLATALGHRS